MPGIRRLRSEGKKTCNIKGMATAVTAPGCQGPASGPAQEPVATATHYWFNIHLET